MMRFSLAAMLLLSGCSLIPAYHRPALPVSANYPVPTPTSAGVPAADIGWRDFFGDPVEQRLIALALANNRDLRVSTLNVEAAQAQFRSDRASLFPKIDATAGIDRSRTPGDIYGSSGAQNIREYSLGASAVSWELDLFGRIRSQAEQARQTYLSDAETRTSAQISLIAQVGAEYLTWLADRDALRVSRDTVKAQADSLRLTELIAGHGSGTALAVAQAETTLRSAEASVAQYVRQIGQDMDELVLLVGTPLPDELVARMDQAPGLDAESRFPRLPAGLPSDLLERRPDVLAAEHTLLGANAYIGAARAAFFPQVTLTAQGGTASSAVRRLFRSGQSVWEFQPSVSLPIFDAGQNFANLDQAKIQKRIEVANYEKTVQSAFHDVSDALVGRDTYVEQIKAEEALVAADARSLRLSQMRFKAGVDTFLNVLVSQNALFSSELNLISLKLAATQNLVTLYKALGGGWEEQTSQTTATRSHRLG
jgi:multidrug efflux system outer membrane protein